MSRSRACTILNRLLWACFALGAAAGTLWVLHARDWSFAGHLGTASIVLLGAALVFALADWALEERGDHEAGSNR